MAKKTRTYSMCEFDCAVREARKQIKQQKLDNLLHFTKKEAKKLFKK